MRNSGWDDLFESLVSFCEQYNVEIPNMSAPYKVGTSRFCQQINSISVEHHHRYDIFNTIIDFQLMELNHRFPKNIVELLYFSSVLDPSHVLTIFKVDDICKFVEKVYLKDFTLMDLHSLKIHLENYKLSMDHPNFQNIDFLSILHH